MKKKLILRQKKYKNELDRQAIRLISRMGRKNMLPELPADSMYSFIINTDKTHKRTKITSITVVTIPIVQKVNVPDVFKSDTKQMTVERPTVMENIGRKWFE